METPVTEGFYWARLKNADPEKHNPEVVYVYSTYEHLFVESPGVEGQQDLDWYEWLSPRITLEDSSRIAELEAEVTRLKSVSPSDSTHHFGRGFCCAAAALLRMNGPETDVLELFGASPVEDADPEDIAIFKEFGLIDENGQKKVRG